MHGSRSIARLFRRRSAYSLEMKDRVKRLHARSLRALKQSHFSKAAVKRMVKEIMNDMLRYITWIQPVALDILHAEAELVIDDLLSRARWAMKHAGRKKLKLSDLNLVRVIRKIPLYPCEGTNMYPSF